MLARGALQVLEVLLQRRFVELREKKRLDRRVVATDFVDELTFAHGLFTFARVASDAPIAARSAAGQRD